MSLPGSYICPHCGVTVVFNPRPILKSAKPPYDAAHPGVIDFSGEDSDKVAALLSHAVNNLCACLIGPFDLKKLADEVEAERKARKNKS